MTSSASLPKATETASSARRKRKLQRPLPVPADEAALGYDLVTQLTYMTNLALSSASRDRILEKTGQQRLKTVSPFLQVYQAVKRLGVEYVAAFQMVANTTRSKLLKGLLLRFAGALSSGDSEVSFLSAELRVELERFEEHYERSLESLRKWTDAYASLLVSVILIIVVAMVSTMISTISTGSILVLGFLMVLVTAVGAWIIYRTAPQEQKIHTDPAYIPTVRRLAFASCWAVAIPGLAIGGVVSALLGIQYGLLIAGFAMLPTGILMLVDERRVDQLDGDVAPVVRSLGGTAAALSSTLAVGLAKMDRRSMGAMQPYMERLNTRLAYRLSTEAAWRRFVAETGSESVRRTFMCLTDAVDMGAPADAAANNAGDLALRVSLLRARRHQVASTFAFLVIPLHVTMVGLMVFIFSIVQLFNAKIESVLKEMEGEAGLNYLPNLPYFQSHDLGMLQFLTTTVAVALTLSNGLTPGFALGGHPLKGALYLGITTILSGAVMIVIPMIASNLLPMK